MENQTKIVLEAFLEVSDENSGLNFKEFWSFRGIYLDPGEEYDNILVNLEDLWICST